MARSEGDQLYWCSCLLVGAVSKLTRSMSEGDLALDLTMPSLTLRVTCWCLKPLLASECSADSQGSSAR